MTTATNETKAKLPTASIATDDSFQAPKNTDYLKGYIAMEKIINNVILLYFSVLPRPSQFGNCTLMMTYNTSYYQRKTQNSSRVPQSWVVQSSVAVKVLLVIFSCIIDARVI